MWTLVVGGVQAAVVMSATARAGPLEYRLLGPLQVQRDGVPVPSGPPKARVLLGCLLLHANTVVSAEKLVDVLWGEHPPATAAHALQVYVAGLRDVLEPSRRRGAAPEILRTERPGYRLAVEPEQIDAGRFELLVTQAREHEAAARSEQAVTLLRAAEALWRGPALADLVTEPFAAPAIARLEELRVGAVEDRIDAELRLGHHARLTGELAGLTAEYPTRERLHGQLMVAQYRCGRQAAALQVFRDLRGRLDEEGLVPSPRLGELEVALLRHAPELAPPGPRPPPAATTGPDAVVDVPDPAVTAVGRLLARKVTAVHAVVPAGTTGENQDLGTALDEVPSRLAACVEMFGGTVVDRRSRSVSAVFGLPWPHEDDPERAVRTALEIVSRLGDFGRRIGEAWNVTPPVVRVGICTGWSPAASAGLTEERTDGPVPAAERLARTAAAGTVMVDRATRTLVGARFRWGVQKAGSAREVTGPTADPRPTRGLPGVDAALVGRSHELATGSAVLERVLTGTGGLLWITGEVGIGKSRLLAELREHAGPRPVRWLQGHCLSYGEGLAYWPIRDLLHDWLGIPLIAPELLVRARLRVRLDALLGADAAAAHVGLASVLDLRSDDEVLDRAPRLSPEAMERASAAAIRAVLLGLAADGPLVIAVEDLHWADAASLRILRTVMQCIDTSRIALLVTQRPERDHPSWTLREQAQRDLPHRTTEIPLGPLRAGEGADLLAALTGSNPLEPGLGRRLLATAEGNPFFLEELVRSLPARSSDSTAVEIPATVEQVLGSRIGTLPAAVQQLLATASVLGRRFAVDVLVDVAGLDELPTDALRELAAHGLVQQTRGWPAAEYEFRHALTHEAAYRSLWPPRRRELHGRAAEVLQARDTSAATGRDAALARHWTLAGDDDRSMACHRRAARAALTLHALDVAEHHFSEGLAAARRLGGRADPLAVNDLLLGMGQVGRLSGTGDPEARLAEALQGALASVDLATEWRARHELGFWLGYVRARQREARSSFEAAADAAERLGEVGGQVAALSRVSILLANDLDLVGALAQSERALRLAIGAADDHAVASALDARKLSALFLGELDVFEELLPRLDAILRRHDDVWTLQFVLAEAAVAAAATARWGEAQTRLAAADELNRRCGDRLCRPLIIATRAGIERSRGAYGDALDTAVEAVAAAEDGGWWEQWARTDLGATLLDLHDTTAAIDQLDRAAEAAMMPAQQVRSLAHLARARWQAGQHAHAEEDLHRAEALLSGTTAPTGRTYLFGADAALACGHVRLARGEPARAEALAEPVLAAAERSGWLEPLAGGLLLTGRCRAATDDIDSARLLVGRAVEVADGAGLSAVAWQGRAVLAGITPSGSRGLLRRARRDVVALSATVPDTGRRTAFADGAFAEIEQLADHSS